MSHEWLHSHWFVKGLVDKLRVEDGIPTWIDDNEMAAGDPDIADKIARGISKSKMGLLFLTQHYVNKANASTDAFPDGSGRAYQGEEEACYKEVPTPPTPILPYD